MRCVELLIVLLVVKTVNTSYYSTVQVHATSVACIVVANKYTIYAKAANTSLQVSYQRCSHSHVVSMEAGSFPRMQEED